MCCNLVIRVKTARLISFILAAFLKLKIQSLKAVKLSLPLVTLDSHKLFKENAAKMPHFAFSM